MFKAHCQGCGAPHLAQAKRIDGQYIYADYCEQACWFKYRKITDEQRQKWSYAGKHRSPEAKQHVLEANRRPRSAETKAKQAAVWRGRKHTEETKAKQSAAAIGKPKSLLAVAKSVEHRIDPDRFAVACKIVKRRYLDGATSRNLVFALSDDAFYKLIQSNCSYCGVAPSMELRVKAHGNVYAREDDVFWFNGVDRLDSSAGYTAKNAVAACATCNLAKSSNSVFTFASWVCRARRFLDNRPEVLKQYSPITDYQQASLNTVFRQYHRHPDPNNRDGTCIANTLTLSTFSSLIRTECYYCGAAPANKCARKQGRKRDHIDPERILYYNGLDRIDSNGIYEASNVVPCCYPCNRAKMCLTVDDFQAWIHRAAWYIKAHTGFLFLAPSEKQMLSGYR